MDNAEANGPPPKRSSSSGPSTSPLNPGTHQNAGLPVGEEGATILNSPGNTCGVPERLASINAWSAGVLLRVEATAASFARRRLTAASSSIPSDAESNVT